MRTSDRQGLEAGAVIVVPFPYADRLAEKRRPAVIISGRAVADAGFLWIAMITSARHANRPGDLPIPDLGAAGLDVASMVRPSKIACIEPSRILRLIGALPVQTAEAVFEAIRSRIGPV